MDDIDLQHVAALEGRIAKLEAKLSRRPEEQYLPNTPHTEKSACPMWYGECLCTVSGLIHNIERANKAEAEVERLRGTLESVREYARTDIELETVGVMTTSIMAIAIAALEPAP